MIEIVFSNDKQNKSLTLIIRGHAGQAEYGQDIVCASASILAYTLAKNIVDLLEIGYKLEADIELESGDSHVIAISKDDETYNEVERIFLSIWTGYLLLGSNYPKNIRLDMA